MSHSIATLAPYIVQDPTLPSLADGVDADARSVVTRLRNAGYEAYLVGGCVRDLLLGREPKDFDVATEAHPSELRMLFRNCRLIGRRFRLAHLHFAGGKIIETATFRANPLDVEEGLPEDLLLNRDNVFGNSEQDAKRRDFTVNGLFFEPDSAQIIDFVDGMKDLRARVLRVIGDPNVRLQEDPVRIMRAVKFAAKLDFSIAPETFKAMRQHVQTLGRCSAARLVEELDRLLQCGAAKRAIEIAFEVGIIEVLLPDLDLQTRKNPKLKKHILTILDAYDQSMARGFHASRAAAMSLLFWPVFAALDPEIRYEWLDQSLAHMIENLHNPKRDRERLQHILQLNEDLEKGPQTEAKARQLVRRAAFGEALFVYAMRIHSKGQDLQAIGEWKATARHFGQDFAALPSALSLAQAARQRRGKNSRRGGKDRRRHNQQKRVEKQR